MAKNCRKEKNETTYAVKDETGTNMLTETNEISERWRQYFQNLLNAGEEEEIDTREDENLQFTENQGDEIRRDEVEYAIKRMKNGKASGEDEIPIEFIKALEEVGVTWIMRIANEAWRSGRIPHDWSKAVVCPIFKKGDKALCSNYRGISLLSHIGKIYERIIERRLRLVVEEKLGEWQYGFRPGRSTVDMIFTMKILLEKSWEWNLDKDAIFIDMEKAFDRIPRAKLWNALEHPEYEIPSNLKRAIKSIYVKCESKVKLRDGDTEWFEVKTGVRQGGVVSPLLFIIFMDRCMKEINEGSDSLTLAYADDVAVICDNERKLQETAEKWNRIMNEYGMKININKTEVMSISRQDKQLNIRIGNGQLRQVTSFDYLGSKFTENNSQEAEIDNRINKFNKNLGMLYPLIRDRNVPIKCKTTIYTTILRPILLYGSETWTLTAKTRSKIRATEMKVLRGIKGVTRRDRIRNTNIREELGIMDILELIEQNRLRWYGHVQRMESERLPKKALIWKPTTRRPVGRPRKRWLDGVDEALKKRGEERIEIEGNETFMDRETWREIVRRGPQADRNGS